MMPKDSARRSRRRALEGSLKGQQGCAPPPVRVPFSKEEAADMIAAIEANNKVRTVMSILVLFSFS